MLDFLKRKKKVLAEDQKKAPGAFTILTIVPESESLIECLGITNERAETLAKAATEGFKSSHNLCEAANKASLVCVHANELFFVGHILSAMHQKHQSTAAMMAILGGAFGRDKK